jgi:phosphoenolpyruvate synthase/pyruvate phosphate dikinase
MNYGYVIELDQIGKHDIKIAGGKGANIGEMI